MAWKVQINSKVEKEIVQLIKNGSLSLDDQIVIRNWINFVEKNGPEALSENSFWNDHALTREKKWKDCRSSSYCYSGRIIYKVLNNKIIIEVLRISPDHNYK